MSLNRKRRELHRKIVGMKKRFDNEICMNPMLKICAIKSNQSNDNIT